MDHTDSRTYVSGHICCFPFWRPDYAFSRLPTLYPCGTIVQMIPCFPWGCIPIKCVNSQGPQPQSGHKCAEEVANILLSMRGPVDCGGNSLDPHPLSLKGHILIFQIDICASCRSPPVAQGWTYGVHGQISLCCFLPEVFHQLP